MTSLWVEYCLAASAVFLIGAAVAKLVDNSALQAFLRTLGLPARAASVVAAIAAPFEGFVGVGLLIPSIALGATWLALAIAAVFVSVQLIALRKGLSCGCYGVIDASVRFVGLARAGLLLALLAAAAGLGAANPPPAAISTAGGFGAISAAAVLLGLSLVAEVIRFENGRPRFVDGAVILGRR